MRNEFDFEKEASLTIWDYATGVSVFLRLRGGGSKRRATLTAAVFRLNMWFQQAMQNDEHYFPKCSHGTKPKSRSATANLGSQSRCRFEDSWTPSLFLTRFSADCRCSRYLELYDEFFRFLALHKIQQAGRLGKSVVQQRMTDQKWRFLMSLKMMTSFDSVP